MAMMTADVMEHTATLCVVWKNANECQSTVCRPLDTSLVERFLCRNQQGRDRAKGGLLRQPLKRTRKRKGCRTPEYRPHKERPRAQATTPGSQREGRPLQCVVEWPTSQRLTSLPFYVRTAARTRSPAGSISAILRVIALAKVRFQVFPVVGTPPRGSEKRRPARTMPMAGAEVRIMVFLFKGIPVKGIPAMETEELFDPLNKTRSPDPVGNSRHRSAQLVFGFQCGS